jgi:Na+/melibiose symporter-like transporter
LTQNLNLLTLFRSDNVENIATIPLASFVSSFVTSIISKQVTRFVGHRLIYLFGCIIGVSGCIWIALEPSPSILKLYLISVIYGAGHSMLIIASLSMTADFIGLNSNRGGSIYSAVTFFDKLLTGVAVFVIESL